VGGCVHWMQREPCASSPAPLTRAGQWGYPFILAKTRSPGRKLCGILSSLYAPLLVLLVCVRLRSVFQADTDSPGSDTVGEERRLVSAAVSAHSIFFFFASGSSALWRSLIGGTDWHSLRPPIKMYNVYTAKDFNVIVLY